MSLPQVVSRDEWLVARRALLAKRSDDTRVRDALNADGREAADGARSRRTTVRGPGGQVEPGRLFEAAVS